MIKLYNSKTKDAEEFKPIEAGKVGMYTCGPTVYDYPHIGNARAYVFADLLKRGLLMNGLSVNHVMNITDVDDKTIRDSRVKDKSLKEFTEFYTAEFLKDLDSLNVIPANKFPKATEHIPEMISMIETLIDNDNAYKAEDGSTYFDISSFAKYGELSGVDLSGAQQTQRVASDEYEKDNAQDFALWKAYDSDDGDVSWDTTLGKGRPGWHIECSAMSRKYLGGHFDIHTGGIDLIFPHHENEIAQSVCCGGDFVNYWMHNAHLMVDGKKMSKSLGNFYTLRDLQGKGFSPLAFRYFLLQAHYRTQTNFTLEALEASQNALRNLYHIARSLKAGFLGSMFSKINSDEMNKFISAVNDDLDSPKALATMWDMLKSDLRPTDKLKTLLAMDNFLGLGIKEALEFKVPSEIQKLVNQRDQARKDKNYKESDRIRDEIKNKGYEVLDTKDGPVIEHI
ncbi:cysteine--tRNA ligase [Candidatus Parcubacteria bacterium]|nr:cysteine--tRNA ligase [Candidatus Parcubacteria bacterium]